MVKVRNPKSEGDYYNIPESIHSLLKRLGYNVAGKATHGLRYECNRKGVFFLSYRTIFSRDKSLPEIHILPCKFDSENNDYSLEMMKLYQEYLKNIGKPYLMDNVRIEKHCLAIKQPTKDIHIRAMNWEDIKEIILKLSQVHSDAP